MASDNALFKCTQCGDCCKGYGGTYLTETDFAAIAKHLGISIPAFKERYCVPSGNRLVLAQRADGFCIFWDKICTIHAIKPEMCRKWPFIDSLLTDIGNWKIMASVCPGIQADADEDQLLEFTCKALGTK
ncbi:MAG: YkgJ family cysteine cluster protein [Desulfobacteraceae bacterium]|jgi:Fe-S-cluster containining protein